MDILYRLVPQLTSLNFIFWNMVHLLVEYVYSGIFNCKVNARERIRRGLCQTLTLIHVLAIFSLWTPATFVKMIGFMRKLMRMSSIDWPHWTFIEIWLDQKLHSTYLLGNLINPLFPTQKIRLWWEKKMLDLTL